MTENPIKDKSLYALGFSFVFLNALLIAFDFYWLSLIPLILIVLAIAFFSLDVVIFCIAFFTPLSLNIQVSDFGLALAMPTEPLLAGVLFLAVLKLLHTPVFNWSFLKHPITLAIVFSLFWNFVTTLSSEMKLVSLKFLIARSWFLVAFYFFGVFLFKNFRNIKIFLILFTIPLCGVVIYTLIRHSLYNFEHEPAHWVMDPFFNDHTSYGAVLAMMLPMMLVFFKKKYSNTSKLLLITATIILSVGIIFSYTRAAWLSLAVAFMVFVIYFFKVNLKLVSFSALLLISLFLAFKTEIFMSLEKNRQDSSNDMAEHIQSMTNINSDASNLERINRWQSAFRMFQERPLLGFGPGTYMFQYAPFQHSTEKTIISTNAGTLGNAHSEYIGPLAEQGILGPLAYLLIIVMVYYRATILYHSFLDDEKKMLVLAIILSFTTYVVHGFINNFLDTDKAAVPFWSLVAMITALDLFHHKKDSSNLPVI
jgi:putative inorganic carbon (HCO3(-)) transporter